MCIYIQYAAIVVVGVSFQPDMNTGAMKLRESKVEYVRGIEGRRGNGEMM